MSVFGLKESVKWVKFDRSVGLFLYLSLLTHCIIVGHFKKNRITSSNPKNNSVQTEMVIVWHTEGEVSVRNET